MGVVKDFETAFNRRDVQGLLACFAEDASYVDTFYGAHAGRSAMRAMFDRMFRDGRGSDRDRVAEAAAVSPALRAAGP